MKHVSRANLFSTFFASVVIASSDFQESVHLPAPKNVATLTLTIKIIINCKSLVTYKSTGTYEWFTVKAAFHARMREIRDKYISLNLRYVKYV